MRYKARCIYAAPYNRGRHPPLPRPAAEATSQNSLHDSVVSPASTTSRESVAPVDIEGGLTLNIDSASCPEAPSRASPELPQMDMQGHYVGPASGLSFLLRVQNKLRTASSAFTFGDAPLPEFDPTFCVMISKEETSALVRRYFDFTVPVDRFLHRPTIEAWLDEFHNTMGALQDDDEAPARRALLWMVFAITQGHLEPFGGSANIKKRSARSCLLYPGFARLADHS